MTRKKMRATTRCKRVITSADLVMTFIPSPINGTAARLLEMTLMPVYLPTRRDQGVWLFQRSRSLQPLHVVAPVHWPFVICHPRPIQTAHRECRFQWKSWVGRDAARHNTLMLSVIVELWGEPGYWTARASRAGRISVALATARRHEGADFTLG